MDKGLNGGILYCDGRGGRDEFTVAMSDIMELLSCMLSVTIAVFKHH